MYGSPESSIMNIGMIHGDGLIWAETSPFRTAAGLVSPTRPGTWRSGLRRTRWRTWSRTRLRPLSRASSSRFPGDPPSARPSTAVWYPAIDHVNYSLIYLVFCIDLTQLARLNHFTQFCVEHRKYSTENSNWLPQTPLFNHTE